MPVVGSTTLKPGEKTVLEMASLMGMHEGMGGPHVFAVDVATNDPATPVKTLRWRFNVVGKRP